MQKRIHLLLTFFIGLCFVVAAQETAPQDTIYNPKINYSSTPRTYTIAGISVTGVPNYEDYVLIGFSGLAVGQEITVPGDDITNAVRRFWRQGLFSDVSISVEKTYKNEIWLNIALKQRPRISAINYSGIKKSEREDLEIQLGLIKGNQITPNMIDRAKTLIKRFFDEKGFPNAEVQITQMDDLSAENNVIVNIDIDKKAKVKVNSITIEIGRASCRERVLRLV